MLFHAGAGYGTNQNTRLHFYILPKNHTLDTFKDKKGEIVIATQFDVGFTIRKRCNEPLKRHVEVKLSFLEIIYIYIYENIYRELMFQNQGKKKKKTFY